MHARASFFLPYRVLRSGPGVVCSEHFDKVLPVELVYLFFLLYLGFRDFFFFLIAKGSLLKKHCLMSGLNFYSNSMKAFCWRESFQ